MQFLSIYTIKEYSDFQIRNTLETAIVSLWLWRGCPLQDMLEVVEESEHLNWDVED